MQGCVSNAFLRGEITSLAGAAPLPCKSALLTTPGDAAASSPATNCPVPVGANATSTVHVAPGSNEYSLQALLCKWN